MSSAASHLRLVGLVDGGPSLGPSPDEARLAIIKENRIAAHAAAISSEVATQVDPRDPRWVLAMQTQARLQGAILTPERRDLLLHNGKRLGLRPFESNLIIAIMQDRARREMANADAARPSLSLVHPPAGAETGRHNAIPTSRVRSAVWPKWFAALAAAAAAAALLIRWFAGA